MGTVDALHELFPEPDDCGQESLLQYIADGFQNESWVEAVDGMWMGEHEHEALIWSWEKFARIVKHEQIFFFHVSDEKRPTQGLVPPSQMLSIIGSLVNRWGLVKQVDAETILFRARLRPDDENDWPITAEQLGAPAPKQAKAGRMNPAGISYLYTAVDGATALAEALSGLPLTVVVGRWIVEKPLIVIDLTHLPDMPSEFDEARHRDREALLFLAGFMKDVQKSIHKNNNEHIEYLPSQVVSEYFYQVFKSDNNLQINGLRYQSTKRSEGINLVFFPKNNRSENRFFYLKFSGYELFVLPN